MEHNSYFAWNFDSGKVEVCSCAIQMACTICSLNHHIPAVFETFGNFSKYLSSADFVVHIQ